MANPCQGHFCDRCAKCRSGVCCQRDRIFPKPKKRPTEVQQFDGDEGAVNVMNNFNDRKER